MRCYEDRYDIWGLGPEIADGVAILAPQPVDLENLRAYVQALRVQYKLADDVKIQVHMRISGSWKQVEITSDYLLGISDTYPADDPNEIIYVPDGLPVG